jgi:SpoVK/Ycf46/Vps4 family AAA+-type ATPase
MELEIEDKHMGRAHSAPKAFTFALKLDEGSNLLHYLTYEGTFLGKDYNANIPILHEGYNKITDFDFWVNNQLKQKYYILWFKNEDKCKQFIKMLKDKAEDRKAKIQNPIYTYTRTGWQTTAQYNKTEETDLIGYNSYLQKIKKDIHNYQKYLTFLTSINEGHKSLNYLLYGDPGTGKTTLIKVLGNIYNCPIYIANQMLMENVPISNILSPAGDNMKIILFEDFDRYLENRKEKGDNMAEILNALDGLQSSHGIIRFFTGNNVDLILSNKALVNRLNSKFLFSKPDRSQFENKLNTLLRYFNYVDKKELLEDPVNKDKLNTFIDKIMEKNITLRPFTNYVIRYLFDNEFFDNLLDNIDEL